MAAIYRKKRIKMALAIMRLRIDVFAEPIMALESFVTRDSLAHVVTAKRWLRVNRHKLDEYRAVIDGLLELLKPR